MSGNISRNSSNDQVSLASSSVWKWPESRQIIRIYQIKYKSYNLNYVKRFQFKLYTGIFSFAE